MGYYGVGPFENDDAQDFLIEILKSKDLTLLFENKEWLREWNSLRTIKASLNKQIMALKNVYESC